MVSTKPYLIRAIHEWCTDEGFSPHIAVQVDERTRVPREFVKDGQIVLNVGAEATHQLQIGNDEITFQARFSGASFSVAVPVSAVLAIYARENGQGMAFEAIPEHVDGEAVGAGETAHVEAETETDKPDSPTRRGGHLTRVK
ncbi:MAG: ClpXP protease specificity-enhancing factor [Gammaproteobacteria bacterium]|nr:ClpXP protease specificity-enhancing factor [Rhodocyclaceae bacterium]MBU3909964.1 ClpXP protease specificity-enhancing factor [Gammaproteobacteria bacterium]MBU3987906.1 ClpXP protease specificity-enhancing factor [Gammaproteobacteria bacterium]MBU4003937.1 ClpXP protease specificity-enhancing factor [Gammaproteobacteria bacterium]MBU4020184.1 ClpXP protease specificity-enhancing factor [Gammaproteobacteria bacterium]